MKLPDRFRGVLVAALLAFGLGDATAQVETVPGMPPVPDPANLYSETAKMSPAVEGAKDLVFRPAYRSGKPIPYPILFPIRFRVPNGPLLPSDTVPRGW